MHRILMSCLALICISNACIADDLSDDELKPLHRMGCKEFWDDRSVKKFIKGCTRALEGSQLTERQRAYAYYVRGTLYQTSAHDPEARADYEQSIALNPSFGPVYYRRGLSRGYAEPSAAIADYRKAIELGDPEGSAAFGIKSMGWSCPSLVYVGKECQSQATAAADVGTSTGMYFCGRDVAMPPFCTQISTQFTRDIGTTWSCPSNVVKPAGCNEPFVATERYACDVQFFKNPPAECTVVSSGGKKNIIDCPANLHPGMLCSHPTAEDLAAHPSIPTAQAAPAPQVTATEPAKSAETAADKPSVFSWLWGSKKPAAEPAPPASSVAAAAPPIAEAPTPPPAAPPAQPAASSDQLVPIPTGCPIDQDLGGWTVRRGTLQGVPVVTTGNSATYSGTATKWTTEGLSLEIFPRKDGKWLPMLFVKNLKHGDASVREITGPYAVVIWNTATRKALGGVESDAGGNNVYREPHTIIGLASWAMEESIDKIEAAPEINIALALPKEDGSGLIDIGWIRPVQSSGLRAAMAAAKPCAVE